MGSIITALFFIVQGGIMLVKDIMTSSILSVTPQDSFEKIRFIMKSEDIGALPVCDNQNHILGIITDRDLILRYFDGCVAEDLMTKSPITVRCDEDIHDAALKFSKHKVRRLPVLEGERIAGMLSLKDLSKKKILTSEIGHIIYNICQ